MTLKKDLGDGLRMKFIKVRLTREELLILIKSTAWACEEFWQKSDPSNTIRVSELNSKLNKLLNEKGNLL